MNMTIHQWLKYLRNNPHGHVSGGTMAQIIEDLIEVMD